MTNIGSFTISKEISHLPEVEKKTYQELVDAEKILSKKYNEVKSIDKNVKEISGRIKKMNEAINRSLGKKIGYGFAGTAVALLCPLSWVLGTIWIVVVIISKISPNVAGDDYDEPDHNYLFVAPVNLCGSLFKKATRSKEQWQANLDKLTQVKTQLENKRLEVCNDINAFNEPLKKQIAKIIEIGGQEIPTLKMALRLQDSISLVERVRQLPQLSGKTKTL
jgi:peptidoglycan hydrolase CwlO-like protein